MLLVCCSGDDQSIGGGRLSRLHRRSGRRSKPATSRLSAWDEELIDEAPDDQPRLAMGTCVNAVEPLHWSSIDREWTGTLSDDGDEDKGGSRRALEASADEVVTPKSRSVPVEPSVERKEIVAVRGSPENVSDCRPAECVRQLVAGAQLAGRRNESDGWAEISLGLSPQAQVSSLQPGSPKWLSDVRTRASERAAEVAAAKLISDDITEAHALPLPQSPESAGTQSLGAL
eukprot:gnl/TRDRNA2_/TRDRNA2_30090_c0_seq1.p1 gnl/TRDRNA2_/TRDRNA2_30090_c0~~gnl/TRDRNA2_/TRDRNA2_30090_c0_seq1.p1  ORF type:complete len:230 (-),score=41.21 gnl/TRDRNA2_/TRDRNA2_30090_c0_seq1:4-693(-)